MIGKVTRGEIFVWELHSPHPLTAIIQKFLTMRNYPNEKFGTIEGNIVIRHTYLDFSYIYIAIRLSHFIAPYLKNNFATPLYRKGIHLMNYGENRKLTF